MIFRQNRRTFEDLEEACGPGGAFGSRFNNTTITREAHFSLVHRCVSQICPFPPLSPVCSMLKQEAEKFPASISRSKKKVENCVIFHKRTREYQLQNLQIPLGCRQELLMETMTDADISEMETAVQAALRTAEGEGWSVLRAGGAARGKSSHDCDFVITCRGSSRCAAIGCSSADVGRSMQAHSGSSL